MNFNITDFPEEVKRALKYYVYRLVDPRNGETFYVGKGKDNRVFHHANGDLKVNELNEEDELSLKVSRIRKIKKTGLRVIHVIHRHGMSEEIALEVEAALIDAYPGITNIMSGYGSEHGSMSVSEIMNTYKAETAELKHRVLMIIINRSIADQSVYNATRYAWKLDVKRAEKAEYILAVEKGMVIDVFVAEQWNKARKQYFPEFPNHTNKRYGFIGKEASEDIKSLYVGKRIPSEFRKKGASNPIKYNYTK